MATMDLTRRTSRRPSTKTDVIVDFWAPWMRSVQRLRSGVRAGVRGVPRVWCLPGDTDEQQELAGAFGIRSIHPDGVPRQVILFSRRAHCLGRRSIR